MLEEHNALSLANSAKLSYLLLCAPLATCKVFTPSNAFSVDFRDEENNTLAHFAALTGDPGKLEHIFKFGCVLGERNKLGQTPLMLAVIARGLKAFDWLVDKLGPKSLEEEDLERNSVLHYVAWARAFDFCAYFAERKNELLARRNAVGQTPADLIDPALKDSDQAGFFRGETNWSLKLLNCKVPGLERMGRPKKSLRRFPVLQIGERKVDIRRFLGAGAFGSVWKVRVGGLPMAMKLISNIELHDEVRAMEALGEGRAFLANLKYCYRSNSHSLLFMEYCDAGSLTLPINALEGKEVISPRCVVLILAQLLLALTALRDAKVLHRDIKPDNLGLDSSGEVRLLDFGLATTEAIGSNPCGTPGFADPNICDRDYSFEADLFSFGGVLYWLLEGRPLGRPIKRSNSPVSFRRFEVEKTPALTSHRWTPEAASLFRLLVEKSPGNRLGFGTLLEVQKHPFFKDVNWNSKEHRALKALDPQFLARHKALKKAAQIDPLKISSYFEKLYLLTQTEIFKRC